MPIADAYLSNKTWMFSLESQMGHSTREDVSLSAVLSGTLPSDCGLWVSIMRRTTKQTYAQLTHYALAY